MAVNEQAEYWTAAEAAEQVGMTQSTFIRSFLPAARARGIDVHFENLVRADDVREAVASSPGKGSPGVARLGR